MPAPPSTAEKKAAASSKASPPAALDPIELEIEKVRQAIVEVQESKDPAFVAKPWRRRDLLVELDERIVELKRIQQQNAQAAAERARRADLKAAWDELQPQRQEIALRWNAMRSEMQALYQDVMELEREHLRRTDRRMLSEGIDIAAITRASFEVIEQSPVLVRPAHL